jgi:hypothetical protein
MKTTARKIGILSWTLYFFISITGVSLQNLYCQCTGKAYKSLFSIQHECEDHHKPIKKIAPCCEKLLQEFSCHANQEENKDCCAPKTQIVKADIDILISSDILLFPVIPVVANVLEFPKHCFQYYYRPKTKQHYNPPPSPYGVELRHLMQSYLC